MRVVRVRTSAPAIAPWGEPVGALRVLGEPLAERQERIARSLGLTLAGEADGAGNESDTLWWDADVDVSRPTLRRFLALKREGRLALVERPARSAAIDVEPVAAGEGDPRVFGLRVGAADTPVVLPARGFAGEVRLPLGKRLPTFATVQTATTVRHWVHLLRANLAALLPRILEGTLMAPWAAAWALLRFRSRALGCSVGRGSSIHPTARLEGCIVGRDVQVGAYSVLRGCVLDDGAIVEDHVTARLAYVGRDGHLANYAMCNLSVLGARTSVGHIGAQACILGDDTFLSTFATLQDLALQGNVRVELGGAIVDSGTPFLGSALGHRVRIGSGITVAAGRVIHNDTTLVSDDVLRRPPGSGRWGSGACGAPWRPL